MALNQYIKIHLLFALALLAFTSYGQKRNTDEMLALIGYPINSQRQVDNLTKLNSYVLSNLSKNEIKQKHSHLLTYTTSAIKWLDENGTLENTLNFKFTLPELYSVFDRYYAGIEIGESVLLDREYLSYEETASIISYLIYTYNNLELYNETLRLVRLKSKLADEKNLFFEEGQTTSFNLAMTYYRLKSYEKASVYFIEQAEEYGRVGNQLMKAKMYHYTGSCFLNISELDTASRYFDIALVELKKPSDERFINLNGEEYSQYFKKVIEGSIGKIKYEEGRYNEALLLFKSELEAAINGNLPLKEQGIIVSANFKIATCYFKMKKIDNAKEFLLAALKYTGKGNNIDQVVAMHTLLGKILLLEDDVEAAEYAFQRADRINDSITTVRLNRENLLALTKFDLDTKESQLLLSRQEVQYNSKLALIQRIALVLALLSLVLILFYYFKIRKSNRVISLQKLNLEATVREKEILLKEVHHRVKNNLQVITGLLQLQSKKAESTAMLKALEDSQRHVNSMALVHEMLYLQEDYALVPMDGYLSKLTNQLLYSFSHKKISSQVKVSSGIELSINKAIPLGLMLSELLSNSNKYAFDDDIGAISVELIETDMKYQFTYNDNGKGLPEDYEKDIKKTLGFRLLHMLTEEISGTIKISGHQGIEVQVTFTEELKNGR